MIHAVLSQRPQYVQSIQNAAIELDIEGCQMEAVICCDRLMTGIRSGYKFPGEKSAIMLQTPAVMLNSIKLHLAFLGAALAAMQRSCSGCGSRDICNQPFEF